MKFKKYLKESSLSRVQRSWSEHDTGTITGFRGYHECGDGDKITLKENKARNRVLKSKLLKRGYGITKIKGSWLENGNKEVGESSFFIVDLKDNGKLERDLIDLGGQFEQDAITFSNVGGDYYAISTNTCKGSWPGNGRIGVRQKLGKPIFGKTGVDGFSRVNGRAFVFESGNITTKFDFYPTEIRSINHIDDGFPDKGSIIEDLSDES